MKLPSWLNGHNVAGVVLGAASYAAKYLIPASLVIPLGPIAVPVVALVSGALTLGAAFGVLPSAVVGKLLGTITPQVQAAIVQQKADPAAAKAGVTPIVIPPPSK